MRDISNLFDYFKRAFHLNKENKELYMPQVALILVKAAMFIAFGVILYGLAVDVGEVGFDVDALIEYGKSIAWWAAGLLFITIIGGLVVESGLYNMYKVCLNSENLNMTVFTDGVGKYFIRMLLASLLMIIFWIILLIPYIIFGVLTLMAGFVLVPVLISIFTAMWKVSMVMDDKGVIESLKSSISFAKENFKPLGALVIIKSAFLSSAGGSGNGSSGNWGSSNDVSNVSSPGQMDTGFTFADFQEGYAIALPYIKTGFYIAIPVITTAIIVGSLIKMVFEIFFNLSFFVMYTDKPDELEPFEDQLSDPLSELEMEVE